MAGSGFVDISILGDKKLERKLKRLSIGMQKKVLRPVMRRSAKRTLDRIIQNLSGDPVDVQTGTLRAAYQAMRVKSIPRSKTRMGYGVGLPERDVLGIDAKDKHYYPAVLEYGSPTVPAKRFIRRAVDDQKSSEFAIIKREIAQGLIKVAKR